MINLIISVTNVNRGSRTEIIFSKIYFVVSPAKRIFLRNSLCWGLACQAMLTRIKKLVTNAFLIQSTTANM